MEVKITVKPNEIRDAVKREIGKIIGSVTADSMVYDQVMGAIWEGMQMSGELPVDSGALATGYGEHMPNKALTWADSKGRTHNRTLYPRQGNTFVTTHSRYSTLHIDPYEMRPAEDVHYAKWKEDEILDAKEAAMLDPWVLEKIAIIVGERAKRK